MFFRIQKVITKPFEIRKDRFEDNQSIKKNASLCFRIRDKPIFSYDNKRNTKKPAVSTNNENKKDSVKNILKNWINNASGHGISRFLKDTHILVKIAWFVLMAVNVAINLVDETPALFPAIDICNLNPYDETAIKSISSIETSLDTLINEEYVFIDDSTSILEPAKNFKLKADGYIRNKTNLYEHLASKNEIDIKSIGFKLEDMLVSCKFQEQQCTVDDFTMYHNYYYGNCYRFNGGRNSLNQTIAIKKSTMPGWRYGLQIELYTGLRGTLSYTNGYRILVHNQSDIAVFPEEDGINLSPGFLSNVAIEKTHLERLSWPYNDCLDNLIEQKYDYLVQKSSTMKLMKNILNMTTYDQNYCIKLCFQRYINLNCNCSEFSLIQFSSGEKSIPGCHLDTQVACSNKMQIEFFNSAGITHCQKDCPFKCNIYKYNTKISTSKYPTFWFIKNLDTSIILDDYTQYVAMINLFYNDMIITEISQTPKITTEMLFGNVGGQLGLFMGISLLSMVEVIELILLLILHLLKK